MRLLSESINVKCTSPFIIANGIPGNPAPVPTSITLPPFNLIYFPKAMLSIKCLFTTSCSYVIAVRFITLFVSINNS